MIADFIERKHIDWVDRDERFRHVGEVRSIPIERASPPPPDPKPKVVLYHHECPVFVAPKKSKKKAPREKSYRIRKRLDGTPYRRRMTFSAVAEAPCALDGGEPSRGPHSKKQWRCVKCDCVVTKKRIPNSENMSVVRRDRVGRTELPPCTDPRGHSSPLSWDGVSKNRKQRMRCRRCLKTRNATPAEIAARNTGKSLE